MGTRLFKIINNNYLNKKKCNNVNNTCDIYVNNLVYLLNDVNLFNTLIDCNNGSIIDTIDQKKDVGAGVDVDKVTIFVKNKNVLFAIKFLKRETNDLLVLKNIKKIIENNKNLFMHAETMITYGICNSLGIRQKIGNMLDTYCANKATAGKKTGPCSSITEFKLNNGNLYWIVARYAEYGVYRGSLQTNKFISKLCNTDVTILPSDHFIIQLQLIWQTFIFGFNGIEHVDMHTENMFVYLDINYDKSTQKYYSYTVGDFIFYIKITPYLVAIADYGYDKIYGKKIVVPALKKCAESLIVLYTKDPVLPQFIKNNMQNFTENINILAKNIKEQDDISAIQQQIILFFKNIIPQIKKLQIGNSNVQLEKPINATIIELKQ
jgi:hypothetical protein